MMSKAGRYIVIASLLGLTACQCPATTPTHQNTMPPEPPPTHQNSVPPAQPN